MGDKRVHEQVIALRAVETSDFMTADWYPFEHEFLKRVSRRIVNEVNGVSRVVYDSKSTKCNLSEPDTDMLQSPASLRELSRWSRHGVRRARVCAHKVVVVGKPVLAKGL
jgi:hypothetical protein